MNNITNLLGLDDSSLSILLDKCDSYSKYRVAQIKSWIYKYHVDSFDQMTNLPVKLRNFLKETAKIEPMSLKTQNISSDGTMKWLFDVGNGNAIETVLIPDIDRYTLCISSQAGCAVNCSFCYTGQQGFNRNLTTNEIISQLWWAQKSINDKFPKNNIQDDSLAASKITNVVMMGMGEPLLNYGQVIPALRLMMDDNAYSLSRRRITLSTSGIVPMIDKMAQDCPVSLAVSLHAPNNSLRNKLMPINKKYPLEELIKSCKNYVSRAPRDFVTFEYCMLENINDNDDHAVELIELISVLKCKVNLIPFNSFPSSNLKRSSLNRILSFAKILNDSGIITTIRKTRGDDILAACGQLAGNVDNITKIKFHNDLNL
ncbi:ribosomal RNA large subunit methyltransferase N [Candidatus Kinetoplastibacterium desouzaii TCC079E]|uniref:Dual-specificity RNA methyltransferase RlmN n=1 Tax=Candidatus Kinetoplastidibacterium desouzai TCC079E TaxID=1208919 RepID=M1M3X9_9PROT|nr:23S rRNA (adenine(2503)-C(2))-methyltransferase RlmN [Candidatus Kinetoplastibacterium desouzaii]AGF46945.1 ribosomal RNA large subunit methyltransferase N [Candidatus Kinetoplastibacterium desouzaii TCC079E]